MKTTDIQKKQALCEELNMNLDEANELFETETLESMQMAQINGGSGWVKGWKLFCDLIGTISDLLAIENAITGGKGTLEPDTPVTKVIDDRGNTIFQVEGYGTISVDSIVNGKLYGVKVDTKPTPTPKPPTYY